MNTRFHTWIFIGSILLAILAGLGQLRGDWAVWVLALLGLLLAYLTRTKVDSSGFLLPAIALQMSAGAAKAIPAVGEMATNVFNNIVTFISGILLFLAVQAIIGRLNFRSYRIFIEGAGVLIALLGALGIFGDSDWPIAILAAIGILVGVLRMISNTSEQKDAASENIVRFLLVAIALLLSASAFNEVPVIGAVISGFFANVVVLISAIMLVIAFWATFRWLEEAT